MQSALVTMERTAKSLSRLDGKKKKNQKKKKKIKPSSYPLPYFKLVITNQFIKGKTY
jgi:hypothetical protein